MKQDPNTFYASDLTVNAMENNNEFILCTAVSPAQIIIHRSIK